MKKQILFTTLLGALATANVSCLLAEELFSTSSDLIPQDEFVPQEGVELFSDAPERNMAFGTGDVWTSVGAPQFMPRAGTVGVWHRGNGYVYPDPSNDIGRYWAQLNLPNGAQVKYVYMPVYDSDNHGHVSFDLYGVQARSSADTTPEYKFFGHASSGTNETPGYTIIHVTPSAPMIIHEFSDVAGDNKKGNSYFYINIATRRNTTSDTTIQFFGAAVKWSRTITPAPTSATFNDVPTNYWAFKEIEALADSGITGGCGAGKFCPDDNVSRAQMAAFLARALGLHWEY